CNFKRAKQGRTQAKLPLAGFFTDDKLYLLSGGRFPGRRFSQNYRSIRWRQGWSSIMDQGLSFLFATVHPADRDVLTTDIHAPVLACLTEDARHWLADAPAHMMGQLPLDLDALRRGVPHPSW
ncbi:MAG: hypothetical protein VCE75_14910, partial [Alphaproteobacteria bacterium]